MTYLVFLTVLFLDIEFLRLSESIFLNPLILFFIYILSFIWVIICTWIILKKAGRKGWESIIPIWNIYILFKIISKKWCFWILFPLGLFSFLLLVLARLSSGMPDDYIFNTLLCLTIIPFIGWIITSYGLTKKFGKSNGFFAGLFFLAPIFFGILAFGNAKYEGRKFNEKYNLKKLLLLVILISLIILFLKFSGYFIELFADI